MQPADVVRDPARDQPAHNTRAHHQRQHPGPARGAKTQVSAIGHDVHLRHGHRHAAADAGHAQQELKQIGWQTERPPRVRISDKTRRADRRRRPDRLHYRRRRRPAQNQRQWQQADHAENAEADVGLAPSDGAYEMLHDRRPHHAREVIAAHANCQGNAASAREPLRGVSGQWPKRGRDSQQTDQHPMHHAELPQAGGRARGNKPQAQAERSHDDGHHDAETIGQAPHQHAADTEADQCQGIRKRSVGARHPEFALHRRQHHRGAVHADAADGHQRQRRHQACPGVGRFDAVAISERFLHGLIEADSSAWNQRTDPKPAALPQARAIAPPSVCRPSPLPRL